MSRSPRLIQISDSTPSLSRSCWAQDVCGALEPHSTGGVYVNILGAGEQHRIRAAYGDNFVRLVELKRKWDPENVFRMNHNIRP